MPQPHPFVQEFSHFVNAANNRDIVDAARDSVQREHLTLIQSKMRFCIAFIETVAAAPNGTDLRNEASVRLARKIMAATDSVDRALPLI